MTREEERKAWKGEGPPDAGEPRRQLCEPHVECPAENERARPLRWRPQ